MFKNGQLEYKSYCEQHFEKLQFSIIREFHNNRQNNLEAINKHNKGCIRDPIVKFLDVAKCHSNIQFGQ